MSVCGVPAMSSSAGPLSASSGKSSALGSNRRLHQHTHEKWKVNRCYTDIYIHLYTFNVYR